MSDITLDNVGIKERFSFLAHVPDARLLENWNRATFVISVTPSLSFNAQVRKHGLELLTAHIYKLGLSIDSGEATSISTGASVDKVSVSLLPPPTTNGLNWWLSLTPYGAELWALLKIKSAGGLYVGGAPERGSFRGVRGGF